MTREDLIQFASQWQFSRSSNRDLAARMTSPEAVAREVELQTALAERYKRHLSLTWAIAAVGVASVFVGLVVGAAQGYLRMPAIVSCIALSCGLVQSLAGLFFGARASDNLSEAQQALAGLAPVIRSSECKTALEFVSEGRPAVLAWRDLAIAERNVLSSFDVQMMRELHYATTAADEAAARQREKEQACRQLYGIADEDALPAVTVAA